MFQHTEGERVELAGSASMTEQERACTERERERKG